VVVLGMGEKWQGFVHRVKKYKEYLDTLPDDEIVVFVDGFDSYILKPLDDLEDTFRSMDCDILVSAVKNNYFMNKIFGTCKDKRVANAGLYMGYVKSMKKLQDAIINEKSTDDQRNLNIVCSQFNKLKVDVDNVIFKNVMSIDKEDLYKSTAFFGQTPGVFTVKRHIRAIKEYSQFLIPEIILVLLIIYFLYLHFFTKQ
jgi:hypothetical protein